MQTDLNVSGLKIPKTKALNFLDEQIAQGEKYLNNSDFSGRASWNQRNLMLFPMIFKDTSVEKTYPKLINEFSTDQTKSCIEYIKFVRRLINDIVPDEISKPSSTVEPAINKNNSTPSIMKKEAKKDIVEPMNDTNHHNSQHPSYSVFGAPNKKYTYDLFVLMPFTDDLKPVYEYLLKKVAKTLNLSVARADDFYSQNSIMQHEIWSAINLASIVVADCTGKNPNVFYEIGIAHTIGKPVILVTQNQDDVPFDLRHIRYIKYELTKPGMIKFESTLTTTIVEIIKDIGGGKK